MFSMLYGIGVATVTFWTRAFEALWAWILSLFN